MFCLNVSLNCQSGVFMNSNVWNILCLQIAFLKKIYILENSLDTIGKAGLCDIELYLQCVNWQKKRQTKIR